MQPQVFGFVWGRPLAAAGTRTPKVETIGVGVSLFVSVGLQAYTSLLGMSIYSWQGVGHRESKVTPDRLRVERQTHRERCRSHAGPCIFL